MERRKALEKMAIAMGYVVAAPTFAGLLQSCEGDKAEVWVPKLLSTEEGNFLKTLVDVVLPKTDTPSASELNVHKFIDNFAAACFEKEQQEVLKSTLHELASKAQVVSNTAEVAALTIADVAPVMKAAVLNKQERLPFARKLRDLTIWGYKCNEFVGEKVLAYLPVPGEYISCGNLNELTSGKAWSE